MPTKGEVPNQVFVGCPWLAVRPKYEEAMHELRKKYPLSFVIVGRYDGQDAQDLLDTIKERIDSSTYAIFDASGGNANVSLEYGYAEAQGLRRAIYLSTHKASSKNSKDKPIIADLAGKKHNQYKQATGLRRLLSDFAKDHAYTKRFESFLGATSKKKSRGEKKSWRAMALKLVHLLDGKREARRVDIVNDLATDGYGSGEIDDLIRRMRDAKLIRSQQGPYSKVWLT
jgi:hypothetical protein